MVFSGSGFLMLLACVVVGPICLGLYELYQRKKQDGAVVEELKDKDGREIVTSVEYCLGLLGYAIGIGNLWRFPFLCGRNGGAAFLVAYFICLFFVSLPAYMIEMVMGQYARKSTIEFFKSVHPAWQGLGWAQAFMLFFVLAYYNVLLGYTCIYTVGALSDPFPWAPEKEGFGGASSAKYWNEGVLNRFPAEVDGSQGFGPVQWQTSVGLLAVWIMVFLAIGFGKQILAKVTWVTVVLPVGMLLVLLFRVVSLEAADEGVAFYIGKFDGSRLGDIGVWRDACVQILFSLSPGMGTAITMSSFTKPRENVYKTCWIVAICNSAFSFIGGFAIFSIVGNITYKINYQTLSDLIPQIQDAVSQFGSLFPGDAAYEAAKAAMGKVQLSSAEHFNNALLDTEVAEYLRTAVEQMVSNQASLSLNMTETLGQLDLQTLQETARAGPGLAFIAIADGMQTFGAAQNVIAVLFFLTLLTLGLDSTFAWAETWISYVDDGFRAAGKPVPKIASVGMVSAVLFLIGLPFCTRMGNELLDTVDNYVGLMFLLFGVFIEGVLFVFFFGFNRFETALRTACGHTLGPIERGFWLFTTHFTMPVIPLCLFIWGFVKDASSPYEGYPGWMQAIGWLLLVICLILIPIGAGVAFIGQKGGGCLDELPGALLAKGEEDTAKVKAVEEPAMPNILQGEAGGKQVASEPQQGSL